MAFTIEGNTVTVLAIFRALIIEADLYRYNIDEQQNYLNITPI